MQMPYKHIIDYWLEKTNVNYEYEMENILFLRDFYISKLEKNKLLKKDREALIILLKLLA